MIALLRGQSAVMCKRLWRIPALQSHPLVAVVYGLGNRLKRPRAGRFDSRRQAAKRRVDGARESGLGEDPKP
jgi:hypothetical protein